MSAQALATRAASLVVLMAGMTVGGPRPASAQALSFGQVRPFVTSFIPVIGPNGAVGGVLVDAEGLVARAEADEQGRVRDAWQAAPKPVSHELNRASPPKHSPTATR